MVPLTAIGMPYLQRESKTPELEKGAVKAVQDLYDVVHYDILTLNMRFVDLLSMDH